MAKPIPTTSTVAEETLPNGSQYDNYRWDSPNGNVAKNFLSGAKEDQSLNRQSGNVSDREMSELLYSGWNGKAWAWSVDWWGLTSHVSNGTISNDAAQMAAQVAEYKRRGFFGAIPTWYGRGRTSSLATINSAMLKMLNECANQGLKFLMVVDALSWGSDPSVAVRLNHLNLDFQYANANYFNHPAYYKINGRPVYGFFDKGNISADSDWDTIHGYSVANGNPYWLWREIPGLTKPYSDGAYLWRDEYNRTHFYSTADSYQDAGKIIMGSLHKGFHDKLTCPNDPAKGNWCGGAVRDDPQKNGQRFLDFRDAINAHYSTTRQLDHVLVATWNDYEEGHEVETGIYFGADSITASIASDGTLSWNAPAANVNCIHHVRVWSSTDGVNLTRIALKMGASAKTGSVNLNQLNLPSGAYTIYVQMVGHFCYQNGIFGPLAFSINAPPVTPAPVVNFSATPTNIVVGDIATLDWNVTGATTVTLNGAPVTASGAQQVSPATTTTYLLSASGPGGVVNRAVTVTVNPAPPPPPPPPPPPGPTVVVDNTNPVPPVTEEPTQPPAPGRPLCRRYAERQTDET